MKKMLFQKVNILANKLKDECLFKQGLLSSVVEPLVIHKQ